MVSKEKWVPKIIKTVAINDIGTDDLYNAINNHYKYMKKTGEMNDKISHRYERKIRNYISSHLEKIFWTKSKNDILKLELNKQSNDRLNIYELFKLLKS